MNVLLINPPWLTKNGNIWHGVKSTSPPLGLLYVAAYAESRGAAVRVMDVNAEELHFENIEDEIARTKPDFIGFTAVTAQIINTHRIAAIAKSVSPKSRIVVGGVHATALPDDVMRDANIDYVIRGEGELAFCSLINGEPLNTIGGLTYRGMNLLQPIEHNPLAEPIADLDSLPTPAYHLTNFSLYRPAIGAYRRLPAVNMTMTRGCPGKCTFCNSAETALRTRSAEHVVDEIERLQARYHIREVSFYDDTFTIYKQHVVRLCDLIVERGLDLTWSCFARTDCVSPSLLKKMRAAGCHQILFGIESADEKILETIRKPIELEQTRRACRMVQEAGIDVRAAFMFGNPGETIESMRRTIDFAKELDPDIALFNITTPYPGTQMFEWARRNGHLRTLDWNYYDLANQVLELPTVSRDEVNQMYRTAYREFYFRPRYLIKRLMKLRGLEDFKANFRAFQSILFTKSTVSQAELDQHDTSLQDIPSIAAAAACA
ncbi:MAG: cobalamin B12-binding domain-containing protein [Planctomycetes bacterium]|nr:cobalamin B12-binding domain-containing protein [Planctomycetota bacterium]MBI3835408.1 cobalamin B12-binding domain-containing protein [Planctomycetota bacterium]